MKRASRPRTTPGPGTYDRGLTPRARRAEQHARLLRAAIEVFAERGFAGASVEAIVDHTGMSRRTFYEHFDGLEGILREVHARSAAFALRMVEGAMGAARGPLAAIEAGIDAFLTLAGTNGGLARVLFREVRAAGPHYERRRTELLERFGAMLARAVERAHEDGDLARGPDEVTIYALTAAIEEVALRYVERRQEARLDEARPALTRLVVSAFR